MDFENMQKIWDQQSNQVVYAFDEQTLFDKVVKKQHSINRLVGCFEWTAIFTFVGLAVFALVEGFIQKQFYQMPLGAVFVGLAAYMIRDRQRRLNSIDEVRDIRSSLDNGILSIKHQIKRQRNIIWWFFAPLIGVSVYQGYFSDKSFWIISIAIAALVGLYWLTQKEIQCKLIPKQNELQRLKELLDSRD